MKTLIFDAYEFENRHAEESLTVSISPRRDFPHPTLAAFADDILGEGAGVKLPPPTTFASLATFAQDAAILRRLAGLAIPADCNWPSFLVCDEWNERHIILDQGDCFISYCWATTA